MPSDRYYYPSNLHEGQEFTLEGTEAHHLISVMRNRVGDHIELVNGKGQLTLGKVSRIEKKDVAVRAVEILTQETPMKQLVLAQAIPKMNRLEYILEKACELGMTEIWLFPGVCSEKYEMTKNRQERLQHILISAMKQCGRLFLPKLDLKPPLKKWTLFPLPSFFGDLRKEALAFKTVLRSIKHEDPLYFFIGPESGFVEEEIVFLEKQQAKGVKLHQNILRTDTAAIIACYLMSQHE